MAGGAEIIAYGVQMNPMPTYNKVNLISSEFGGTISGLELARNLKSFINKPYRR